MSRFNPSQFTLEALSIYCNYSGWEDFCNQQLYESSNLTSNETDWINLQRNTNKITSFTLDAIKGRAGIPYNKTIKRSFINDQLSALNASCSTGAIISAPIGYGKTIALCHWIEEQIELNESKAGNDIILFFSSSALVNAIYSGRDINDWVLGLLGYTNENDINALWDEKQRKNSKFYLVIDGFDPYNFKADNYFLLMRQINELFALYDDKPWMKIILSMRNDTWLNYKHEFVLNEGLMLYGLDNDSVNVPVLTQQEIKSFCKQFNPALNKKSYTNISTLFNSPMFFQLYYKKHKENFSIDDSDHSVMYDLVYSFYFGKMNSGANYTEKKLIINKIAEHISLDNENQGVSKLAIYYIVKKYNCTYQELLLSGILMEDNSTSVSNDYNVNIKFGNQHYASLAVAFAILNETGYVFDDKLIDIINQRFVLSASKITVLRWCLLHAIKTGQQNNLVHLTTYPLSPADKFQMVVFIGDVLAKTSSTKNNEDLLRHFEDEKNDVLFDYFFAPELFNKDYQETLKYLLKFNISDKKRILVYTALGILSALNLELDELYIYLVKLKSFSTIDTLYYAINPTHCLDAIYHYFKYGIAKKECMAGLTHLCFSPPSTEHELKHTAANDVLYILGMYTMFICNNPKKTLRFVNVIKSVYKSDESATASVSYSFFVKAILSDIYFRLGDHRMVTALYYTVSNLSARAGNTFSPFLQTILSCLKIKCLLAEDEPVLAEFNKLKAVAEVSGSKLSLLITLVALLKNEKSTAKNGDFYIQIYNDYKKLMYQHNINSGLYNSNYVLINK
ncbi:hypothetical protein [Mucilaginibacter sp.]